MTIWKDRNKHAMPEGESVLCWDGINNVMFTGYWTVHGIIAEPHVSAGPTPFTADWWRPLPPPPPGAKR